MSYTIKRMNTNHNLYFHIPFCASKCKYCAFYSHASLSPNWNQYLDNILSEINFWKNKLGKINVPTIFFGGGTPSLMPTDIFKKLMTAVYEKFNILPNCEITMESNPGTMDKNKLAQFQKLGINRLSVGVQSLNDDELQFMGRTHTAKQALDLLSGAAEFGLKTSADFIYGLPNQTVRELEILCEQINNLNLKHVSMYELTIEPGTPFFDMNLNMPDNETMADMYESIDKNLNLPRYEVSNYAANGFECAHNQNIWDGEPYIGFGRAAAGRPIINGTWFEQTGGDIKLNPIDNLTRATEKIITGMRTVRGVQLKDDVKNIINWDFVNKNSDLFIKTSNRLSASKKGILILDDLLINLNL